MSTLTQITRFRQSVVTYSYNFSIKKLFCISTSLVPPSNAGLVVFWVKLRQRGYSRSVPALWRILRRLALIPVKPPDPEYIQKPYENMLYPGQRVQADPLLTLFPKSRPFTLRKRTTPLPFCAVIKIRQKPATCPLQVFIKLGAL